MEEQRAGTRTSYNVVNNKKSALDSRRRPIKLLRFCLHRLFINLNELKMKFQETVNLLPFVMLFGTLVKKT